MKKILFGSIFLLLLSTSFLFCVTQKETFKSVFSVIPFKNASWVEKITTISKDDENSPEKVSETARTVYYKTGKMRIEYTAENPISQEVEPTVLIYKDNAIYNYMPGKKLCVRYALDSTLGAGFKPVLDMWDGKKAAVKTGEDTIDGVKCGIYEYKVSVTTPSMAGVTAGTINSNCKEWRDESDNFEVYSEQKTDPYTVSILFISKTVPSSMSKVKITDLNKNAGISDSMFDIPKDAQVKDIDELYGGKNPHSASGEENNDKPTNENSDSGKTGSAQNYAIDNNVTETSKAVVKSEKDSYFFMAPAGWVMKEQDFSTTGFDLIMYPAGGSWEKSPMNMFANIPESGDVSIKEFVQGFIDDSFKHSQKFAYKFAKKSMIQDKYPVTVLDCLVNSDMQYQRVVFIKGKTSICQVIFEAKDSDLFAKNRDSIYEILDKINIK